ncbi:hypothetical protein EYF80_003781 [Liparis tanakae]|uniref:Uncharacterized protein n=1 Tax=Liparis tanakae TaxID=230148 RepID=A0A4Z2J7D0_9TELE|nr:hypothetical protein EYF80_003781 [Liparis tanakae]
MIPVVPSSRDGAQLLACSTTETSSPAARTLLAVLQSFCHTSPLRESGPLNALLVQCAENVEFKDTRNVGKSV